MKNLRICISILLLIAGLYDSLTAQPQYYNYNTAGSGSNSFPWNITTGKDVQLLYLAGDFNQPSPAPAGNILSVSFFISPSYPLGPWTYTDLTIKMAQSGITSFTTGSFYSPLTTVYYRASVALSASAGTWMTITLDTPFAYDPTQSLIVDIGQCAVPGAVGFSSAFTTLTGNRRIWSVGGCPFVYSSYNSAIYHLGVTLGASSGPPIVVTTAATAVTSTSATLNGTVNANGAATTVSFEYGLTTAYGTTVPGVPASVSGSVVTPVLANITGLLPGNTYHFRVKGTNSFGTTNGNDLTFTTPAILPAVVTTAATGITGTGATLNGTVDAGGASTTVTFEYGLTVAYGTTIPGVPGTVTGNGVTPVSASLGGLILNTTYHYRVKGVNSVGTSNGNDMTFLTTNCPAPGAPGVITGPSSVCGYSSGKVYSVAPISGATGYTWAVPPGALITTGINTNSITVTFGNTSGTVSVNGTNSCGNGSTSTLAVTVNAAPIPTISGQSSMCVNSGYYTYTTEAGMTNYSWIISSGGTISYGLGTNQIQVIWNVAGSQSINVNYTNAAGCSAVTPTVFPVTVNALPGNAGVITGMASPCAGALGVAYSVAPIPYAITYVWSLPAGVTVVSGAFTNSITVNFAMDASSGLITVFSNNICGNGGMSPPFAVTVNPKPPAPVVINTGYILYSSAPIGNQWYFEGNFITGATSQTHDATLTGTGYYWSIVTLNGCSSDASNHVMVISTGVESHPAAGIDLYPVPNNGRFTVSFSGYSNETYTISVFNNLGVKLFEEAKVEVNGATQKVIDLRPIPSGVYTMIFENSLNQVVRKIIVNK